MRASLVLVSYSLHSWGGLACVRKRTTAWYGFPDRLEGCEKGMQQGRVSKEGAAAHCLETCGETDNLQFAD